MALNKKQKTIALVSCAGDSISPLPTTPIDLTQYDKFAGKGSNPSLPANVVGNVVSYDFSSWVNFPEAWSEACGVWMVDGVDRFVGQGTSCANTWANLAAVLATMNALDPNGLVWSLSGTTISATAPTAVPDPNVDTYMLPTCANISDLQAQIDALAATDKYVTSGVIVNPNTANATLVLTLSDNSTISINVGSLEDTVTAAQIIALFPNGASTPVTVSGSAIRFLGHDGQWHVLTIPATTNTLTSSGNTITNTTDGIAASASIVNSNALSLVGAAIFSTVNGVASNALNLAPVLPVNCSGNPVNNGVVTTPATAKDTGLVTNQNTAGCQTLTNTLFDVAANSIANASNVGNVASGTRSNVGGGSNNVASATNAVISGGNANKAEASNSAVSAGSGNDAAGTSSFIGAGNANITSNTYAAVVGGNANVASGANSVVGAGSSNQSIGASAGVLAGQANVASGNYSFIGSGVSNAASGDRSAIGGGTTNVAGGQYSAISGGLTNVANGNYSSVAGGIQNTAGQVYDAIGGGINNKTDAGAGGNTISGGNNNQMLNATQYSVIGGGVSNVVNALGGGAAPGSYSVIAGGVSNKIEKGYVEVISGGNSNIISSTAYYNVIGGGSANKISGVNQYDTIGGGGGNVITKTAGHSDTIAGGYTNTITPTPISYYNTISGGGVNTITGNTNGYNSIGGGATNVIDLASTYAGIGNTISGGINNAIKGTTAEQLTSYSTIMGGTLNEIRGHANAIAGGYANKIGVTGNQNAYVHSSLVGGYNNVLNNELGSTNGSYTLGDVVLGYSNTVNGSAGSVGNVAIGASIQLRGHLRQAFGYNITAANSAGTTDDNSVFIAGVGQKLSFYNVAPVARQALAASPTTAQIRTVLFNLGLVA